MITGPYKLTLPIEAVKEAMAEWLDKHVLGHEAFIKVTEVKIEHANGYGSAQSLVVEGEISDSVFPIEPSK